MNGPACADQLSVGECNPLYAYAYGLCANGRIRDALPLFRLLCLYGPASERHAQGLEWCLAQLDPNAAVSGADEALLFRMREMGLSTHQSASDEPTVS